VSSGRSVETDLDFEFLRKTFVAEADEGLNALEESLLELETNPDNADALHEIFRTVHTIKGSAAMVGYDNLSEFAHLLEDALDLMRSGAITVTPVRVTLLLQSVDAMRGIMRGAAAGRTSFLRDSDRALAARLIPTGLVRGAGEAASANALQRSLGGDLGSASRARTLRVDMERLDSLLDLAGEIAVARERLMLVLGRYRAAVGGEVLLAAEAMDRLAAELQEQVMTMRLVPLGPVFRQHLRTVRDVAATQGKLVRLVIDGEEVEVDASVVDHLRDPLTHMIRNATDHGIEFPAARKDAGKDPCGTITLSARHEGSTVVIQVTDDGAGLNRSRIVERARERGLIPNGATLTDREIARLIMEPGFSTAETVSELSGRGVGMDVVRRNIETLRGSIEIEGRERTGTVITIRLPLTVAIISGFTVGVAGESYVIPLDAVTECVELPATESRGDEACGVINLRGEPVPFVRVRRLFELSASTPERENVVVVEHRGRHAGLVVDQLLGESQVVVKPLGRMFKRLAGISGSTILGNGRVALILDVPDLLQSVLQRESGAAA
jgi:two-component system, chemotaxis family, sensor kinase CheA